MTATRPSSFATLIAVAISLLALSVTVLSAPSSDEQQATQALNALNADLIELRGKNPGASVFEIRDAFEKWFRQHSAILESLRPLLERIAAAAERKIALVPVPAMPVPPNASSDVAQFTQQENALTQSLANLRRNGLELSPAQRQEFFSEWQQSNADWLAAHRALAEGINAQAASADWDRELVFELPPNVTPRERQFWLDDAEITEALLDLRRKYAGASAEERQRGTESWFAQNAAFLAAHEQLRQQLSHP